MMGLGAKPTEIGPIRYYFKEHPNPKGVFIMFHGNGGSACDRYDYLESLQSLPLHFVFIEYPGYAGDRARTSEKRILEQALHIADHFSENKIPLYIFGESLGTAPATYVAAKREVGGLILMSPFTSISDVAQHHYFYLPVKYIIRNPFKAYQWAPQVKASTLVLASPTDEVVPFKFTKKVMEYFTTPPKLIEFPDTSHNFMSVMNSDLFWTSIKDFLNEQIDKDR